MLQRVGETTSQTWHALAVAGEQVSSAHSQVADILRSRLGRGHADLFALPAAADASGAVAWSTRLEGLVVPAANLPPDEQRALRQRAERMLGDVRGLADTLRAEGPAAQMVGDILRQFVRTPAGDWLYSVGGKPVLVLWGHADAPDPLSAPAEPVAATSPSAPHNFAASSADAAAARGDASAGVGSAGTAVSTAVPIPAYHRRPVLAEIASTSPPARPRRAALMAVLIATLVLLAIAAWWLASRHVTTDDAGNSGALERVERDNRALEEAIVAKRAEPLRFECIADPEPPAPAASEPAVAQASPEPLPERTASAPAPPPAVPKPAKPLLKPAPPASAPVEVPRVPEPRVAQASPPEPVTPPKTCAMRSPGDAPEVVMIIDASGSMREPFGNSPSRLEAAKGAAAGMIRGLPDDVDVGLVDFAACDRVRRDKFYKAPQRGALIGEISQLSPQQGTPLAKAIQRAGAVASRSAESVMVVVTDGDDSCGGDPCAAARAVKASRSDVTINVIDLSTNPNDRRVLQCIADAGGGKLLRPGDPLDLQRKLKEAAGPANCP